MVLGHQTPELVRRGRRRCEAHAHVGHAQHHAGELLLRLLRAEGRDGRRLQQDELLHGRVQGDGTVRGKSYQL